MPALVDILDIRVDSILDHAPETSYPDTDEQSGLLASLLRRVYIPYNSSSPAGLIEADTVDPWNKSGKYALGWVYFSIILLISASIIRFYHIWTDKIRLALHREEMRQNIKTESPATDNELSAIATDKSTHKFFPRVGPLPEPPRMESSVSSLWITNGCIALMRFVFYRPLPVVTWHKKMAPLVFPSLSAVVLVLAAFTFVMCYCFIPQPYYWQSIAYGSPPLAIRAGMIAVAMMPWIVGLSMKANLITFLTGIHHERLNVLHRWLAYICLVLSLIHTIPFYITPVWDRGGLAVFKSLFGTGYYIYGTGEFPQSVRPAPTIDPMSRHRSFGTPDLPLHTFLTILPSQNVRIIRDLARPGINHLPRDALLALQELPNLLELSMGNNDNLATLLRRPRLLSQLGQSLAHVVAHRRGSRHHIDAGERAQDHHSDADALEVRPVRVPSNAGHLDFREPSIHRRVALQR